MRHVLVIGGGTAGVSAALSLVKLGIQCTLVEQSPRLGGKAADLTCKGVRECVKCDVCMSTERVPQVFQSDLIRIVTSTEVGTIERDLGRYRVGLVPCRSIDPSKCDGCMECKDICPPRAITEVSDLPGRYRVDSSLCPFPVEDCTACVDICPQDAIRTGDGPSEVLVDVIVLAFGHDVFNAAKDPRLGHGQVQGVVTASELEAELNRTGSVARLSGGTRPKSIGFIQCVGSRGSPGVEHCSKVCCKYAIKLGQMLRAMDKDVEITYYLMDWRRYVAEDSIENFANADPKVKIVRGRPAEVRVADSGLPSVRFSSMTSDELADKEHDLVVLSVGLMPPAAIGELAGSLGTPLSPSGFFFAEGNHARVMGSKGVFSCGSCSGPKDIEECVMDGETVAMRASAYLEGKE